jgi:hypothetical protein
MIDWLVFSNVQLNDDQNLEHMYQQFEDNFLNCMEIALPKISKSSKKFNRPCWWNQRFLYVVWVVKAKSIILLLFRLVACPSFKQIN